MTLHQNEFVEPDTSTSELGRETVYFRHRQLLLNDAIRDSKLIYLRSAGYTEATADYCVEHDRCLTHNLFEYVVSGKGYVEHEGVVYALKPGDFCLIRAGGTMKYYADPDDPYVKKWFSASGTLVERMLGAFKVDEPVHVASCDVDALFERMFAVLTEKGHEEQEIMHVLLDVLYRACGTKQQVGKMSCATQIKYYIDRDICSCSVESIVAHFNYSRRHLGRIFHQEYGMTMSRYILKQRLAIAERMLVESNCAVAEVAMHLGFCNQNHFSTIFKQAHDMTPTEYRNRYSVAVAVNKQDILAQVSLRRRKEKTTASRMPRTTVCLPAEPLCNETENHGAGTSKSKMLI